MRETLSGAHRRLRHPRSRREGPIWPRALDRIVLLGLLAIAVASAFDGAVTEYVRQGGSAAVSFLASLTILGESQWYLVPAALLFFGATVVDWRASGYRRRRFLVLLFGQAGFAFAAVALAGIIVNLGKVVVGRARPKLFDTVGAYHFEPFSVGYDFASFPSGHSGTMGALTALLVLRYPRLAALWVALGLTLSATRAAASAHYPSDILAGFLLGMLVVVLLARAFARRGVVFRFRDRRALPSVIGGAAKAKR